MDQGCAGLVGGHDEDLADVDVGGPGDREQDDISDICGGQGGHSFVRLVGACLIAVEAHGAELGIDETGLDLGDANAGAGQIELEPFADGADGGLGRAVDIAVRVGLATGDGSDVDDMPPAPRDHARDDGACDIQQALDVGIDHLLPIVDGAGVDLVEPAAQSSVVDQDVDLAEVVGKGLKALRHGVPVADVELDGEDLLSAERPELGGEPFEAVDSPGRDNEARTCGSESACTSLSDSATRAGNQRCRAHQVHATAVGGACAIVKHARGDRDRRGS